MAYISITSSLSQLRSPSATIGIEQTPIHAHSATLGSVEPHRVYPKRESTPRSVSKIETRGYPKREHTPRRVSKIDAKSGPLQRPSKFFIRRESFEYIEHVYEGANIRDFFCKLEDCPRMKRCFPSRHRIEKHLFKTHGIRVQIPDVRKMKKKVKETKMPGRMEDLLKEEAKAALFGYPSEIPEALVNVFVAGYMHRAKENKKVTKKREGCFEAPIDLCTPTPKKRFANLDGGSFHAFVDGEDAIEEPLMEQTVMERETTREQANRGRRVPRNIETEEPPRRSARLQAMLIGAK